MMTHEEALNMILANSCNRTSGEDGFRSFEFDLHCLKAKITARVISLDDPITYDILTCELEVN
jgi:hypothetical protein